MRLNNHHTSLVSHGPYPERVHEAGEVFDTDAIRPGRRAVDPRSREPIGQRVASQQPQVLHGCPTTSWNIVTDTCRSGEASHPVAYRFSTTHAGGFSRVTVYP